MISTKVVNSETGASPTMTSHTCVQSLHAGQSNDDVTYLCTEPSRTTVRSWWHNISRLAGTRHPARTCEPPPGTSAPGIDRRAPLSSTRKVCESAFRRHVTGSRAAQLLLPHVSLLWAVLAGRPTVPEHLHRNSGSRRFGTS